MKFSAPADLIPHRPPFLFVDEIMELDPGVSATAIWTPNPDWDIFDGHFPGNPVLPGVLQVEAIAQVIAYIYAAGGYDASVIYFGRIEKASFRRPSLPGEKLTISAKITENIGMAVKGHGTVTVGGKKACTASIMAVNGN